MRWLLISGRYNPGDCFARIGVENLIKEVDPQAEFDLLDKDQPEAWFKRKFDRAIIAGGPLFWSHPAQTCSEIWWWENLFDGWVTEDRAKVMALGVGDFIGKDGVADPEKYEKAIKQAISRTWAITTRNPMPKFDKLNDSVCPSMFAIEPKSKVGDLRLCNLMPGGGHEPHLDPAEAKLMEDSLRAMAEHYLSEGYGFVAHDVREVQFAASCGFDKIWIFLNPRKYLDLYARCTHYVGHRLHGAMVAYSAGAEVTAIGYDSRVKMLERVGCRTVKPSEYLRGEIRPQRIRSNVEHERQRLVKLLAAFAK